MILDLPRFVANERPLWEELTRMLDTLEEDPDMRLPVARVRRLHELYRRAAADLARVSTFAAERDVRAYLEALVARAYGEVHETRSRARLRPRLSLLIADFPRAVRAHARALLLSVAFTALGAAFGAGALALDPASKDALLPFSHLLGDPRERVLREEKGASDRLAGQEATFSSYLVTHNVRVSLTSFALGATWGIGTAVVLLYNGVVLGAVLLDYVRAGQTRFVLGWLLPHGAVEIPAFVLAGQAGLVLASALIGWGDRRSLASRLSRVGRDLVCLLLGVAALLVWAGIVEAFLSQVHEPRLPYTLKIALGAAELAALGVFLARAGRGPERLRGRHG
ncbi:MAG TPA: stage II sporulation protein M [Thermoanaerobaculia bacterium]|nr:stage II sporulation protein M [Thermoanaerobaculia bacterium]